MIGSILILMIAAAFVFGAVRILLGWFAPASVGSFDRALSMIGSVSAKLLVLLVAFFIVGAVVYGLFAG